MNMVSPSPVYPVAEVLLFSRTEGFVFLSLKDLKRIAQGTGNTPERDS